MSSGSGLREHWGSRVGFILAAAGSAIGLGNIWKFPFIVGMNGGAAFVLFYLLSIILIGLPVMLIEFTIGRSTQLNPVGAFRTLAPEKPYWIIGLLGVIAGFIILSYYSVVAGWTLAYILKAFAGGFAEFSTPEAAKDVFNAYAGHYYWPIVTHLVFISLCVIIVIGGVKGGIERWNRILMPTLFIILLVLVVRGVTLDGAAQGLTFFFKPDFSKLTGAAMMTSMGHAFFTLSLGMGAMLTYGSYLSEKENLASSALWIVITDTLVSILAGVAIFTALFAFGFEPGAGPGLVFLVLPAIFAKMPGGYFVGILFFILLSIAAFTSGISLLEVVTAYFIDEKGWSRRRATLIFGAIIFVLGVPSALSFGPLSTLKLFGKTIFDFLDYLSFKYMLPIGGLLMVIFTIVRWKPVNFLAELRRGAPNLASQTTGTILVISALFVALTFLAGIFSWGG